MSRYRGNPTGKYCENASIFVSPSHRLLQKNPHVAPPKCAREKPLRTTDKKKVFSCDASITEYEKKLTSPAKTPPRHQTETPMDLFKFPQKWRQLWSTPIAAFQLRNIGSPGRLSLKDFETSAPPTYVINPEYGIFAEIFHISPNRKKEILRTQYSFPAETETQIVFSEPTRILYIATNFNKRPLRPKM